MAIWGALAKGAIGAVKGGAKKIAANKLLGRGKKKPQKPQQEGAEQEKGGALAIRPTTALVATGVVGGGALATTGDSGGASGASGGGGDAAALANSISTKIIRVEKLLKGSLVLKQKQREDLRIAREKASDKAQEKALEKSKPPEAKKGPKVNLPGKGLLARIFGFFGTIILGWIAVRLIDWLPKIMPVLKVIGKAVDGILWMAGKIFDGLTWFIDKAYVLYDAATGWIKDALGEEGAEKFDIFMGNVKKLIQGFLVWKIIGEKIFKAIVQSIKNTWKIIKGAFVRAFKIAKAALKAAWNLVKNIPGVRQAAGWIGKQAGRLGGAIKGLGSRILGGATQGGAKVATKVGGLVAKWFGPAAKMIAPAAKAAKPFVTKFASRVPILGPIIVAVVSLMSGEPLGQALFKGLGAALGGFLGTTAGIAITAALGVATAGIGAFLGGLITPAMTILGELIGTFIGDLLYNLFLGGGLKDMMGKLKGMLIGGLKKVLAVGDFIKDFITGGFSRFWEGIPKFKVPDIPEEPPGWIPGWVPMKNRIWNAFRGGIKILMGPLSLLMGKEIPNLLWLVNPMNTTPLLIKSFFPPQGAKEGGGESGGKSTSPASASPPSKESKKIDKEAKKKEKEEKRKEKLDAMKKKIGNVRGAVTGAASKAWNWLTGGKGGVQGGDTSGDTAFQKQENELIAANQKKGYDGVMEKIESYASYEEGTPTTVKVSIPPRTGQPPSGDSGGSSNLIISGGGGGDDPYEALDMFG